ncbi:kinase-like domain-containing protein [Phialemonium atrogriseum]|uniref:Kinase-like domain-containing protein n=1 Tax=Phialemonium atrogriseum TaxID=1093897 RepID=A0AAJ0C3I2_9PEZI|nr:kinase-like domain-containing protein [Phialemonium atrogriseum]KAK1768842.1 kinase-like domain-containing protein [Phialemonium atrogriseum]
MPDKSISYCHSSLTFDEDKRLVVKDWGSLEGTEVTYNGEGQGKRRKFQWIVSGHGVIEEKDSIIINVNPFMSFQIVVAKHDISSQAYIDKVDWFCQGTATTEDLLGDLNFPDRGTERPTGTHTPDTGAIHLRKRLGEGSFGVVTHFWNVSDGSEYALKEPSAKAIRKRKVNVDAWAREARIMGQISHDNVVKLLNYFSTPHPQLLLEYMPCGSLEDQENISADECLSIRWQGLCALTYLHSHEPPIVHRDIKPDNILVQHRFPGDIFVKFGDFGLPRDSCDLSTVCGSQHYLAPEIYCRWQYINSGGKERTSYTPAVDVWSLGVKVVKRFKEDCKQRPDRLRRFLLDAMVVISSDLRCSAQVCSDQVALPTSAAEDGCQTPTPASYAYGEEQTSRYNPEDRVAENQETVLWQQASPSIRRTNPQVTSIGLEGDSKEGSGYKDIIIVVVVVGKTTNQAPRKS